MAKPACSGKSYLYGTDQETVKGEIITYIHLNISKSHRYFSILRNCAVLIKQTDVKVQCLRLWDAGCKCSYTMEYLSCSVSSWTDYYQLVFIIYFTRTVPSVSLCCMFPWWSIYFLSFVCSREKVAVSLRHEYRRRDADRMNPHTNY